jgi:hypothetical protein
MRPLFTLGLSTLLTCLAFMLPLPQQQGHTLTPWDALRTPPAHAAKKKKPKPLSDTQIQELLTPITEGLASLEPKIQGRRFLSAAEASQLTQQATDLLNLAQQAQGHPDLPAPLYRMATLLQAREAYEMAFELYAHLIEVVPTSPYGVRAKRQLALLAPKLPEGWVESVLPPLTPPPAEATPLTKPASPAASPPSKGA